MHPARSGANLSCWLTAGCEMPNVSAMTCWLMPVATIARNARLRPRRAITSSRRESTMTALNPIRQLCRRSKGAHRQEPSGARLQLGRRIRRCFAPRSHPFEGMRRPNRCQSRTGFVTRFGVGPRLGLQHEWFVCGVLMPQCGRRSPPRSSALYLRLSLRSASGKPSFQTTTSSRFARVSAVYSWPDLPTFLGNAPGSTTTTASNSRPRARSGWYSRTWVPSRSHVNRPRDVLRQPRLSRCSINKAGLTVMIAVVPWP